LNKPVEILGVTIRDYTPDELLDKIIRSAKARDRAVFAYANIHAVNLAHKLGWFKEFLNTAAVCYADGQGLRLGAKLLGEQLGPSTALTRFIHDLAARCASENLSLFLLGGAEGVAMQAAAALTERHPGLTIAGTSTGYFADRDEERIVQQINAAAPGVLIVGMGMPRQEKFIERHRAALECGAILPGGSCIDYAAGTKRPAPQWISTAGVEWLYRLFHEPKLFGRYIIGNPLFIARVLRQRYMPSSY
jgi:N-acetylglucosaminyldiphosphoundecaprenol N-acetyl-beta-D-mannosaminyltransferase